MVSDTEPEVRARRFSTNPSTGFPENARRAGKHESQFWRRKPISKRNSLVWLRLALFNNLATIALDRDVGFILESTWQVDCPLSVVHLFGICEQAKVVS